jgi:sugar/nucleoside kinase (ribokinase family)
LERIERKKFVPFLIRCSDAFAAGLIAGFLEGLDWEAAARMGCAVAALKIRHLGARSGLPNRERVRSLLGTASGIC